MSADNFQATESIEMIAIHSQCLSLYGFAVEKWVYLALAIERRLKCACVLRWRICIASIAWPNVRPWPFS